MAPRALCTFSPDGAGPVALGTEDCWIEVIPETGQTSYVVHSNYVDRDGNPFYIEGDTRRRAEEYARILSSDMGNGVSLRVFESAIGPLALPPPYAVTGTLNNPFTGLSESGLYFISISHTDQGGRYYGMTIRFSKPTLSPSEIPSGDQIVYKDVPLGNIPVQWSESVDTNFLAIQVVSAYEGEDAKYLSSLADAVGFDPVFKAPVLRGLPGNRGVIKGYHAVPGNLEWKGTVYENVYLTSLRGRRDAQGLLEITSTFEAPR